MNFCAYAFEFEDEREGAFVLDGSLFVGE